MTRAWHLVALVTAAAVVATSCARLASGAFNGNPADLYAAGPTVATVQSMMGDSNWWAGPPTFEVRPLDAGTMADTEKFGLGLRFVHIGTAEEFFVHYTAYDTVAAASRFMDDLKARYGSTSGVEKVGDDTLYLSVGGAGGAAPYVSRVYVRLASIIAVVAWARKDGPPSIQQLHNNAKQVVDGLQKVVSGKVHGLPSKAVDQQLQPPAGLDITYLGSAQLPNKSFVVMLGVALPLTVLQLLQTDGVNDFAYGDYVLNLDTHMEVQSALLSFPSAANAIEWRTTFATNPPDTSGIASDYIHTGGTPASGEYRYLFTAGSYGAMLVCKPTIDGEAASRECEDPMERTAIAWKIALRG